MFELSNVILLRGVRVYILVKNAKGDMKVMYTTIWQNSKALSMQRILGALTCYAEISWRNWQLDDNTSVYCLRRYTLEAQE